MVAAPRLTPLAAAAIAAWMLAAAAAGVEAGDPPLSPKGVNYEVAALMAVKSRLRDQWRTQDLAKTRAKS